MIAFVLCLGMILANSAIAKEALSIEFNFDQTKSIFSLEKQGKSRYYLRLKDRRGYQRVAVSKKYVRSVIKSLKTVSGSTKCGKNRIRVRVPSIKKLAVVCSLSDSKPILRVSESLVAILEKSNRPIHRQRKTKPKKKGLLL